MSDPEDFDEFDAWLEAAGALVASDVDASDVDASDAGASDAGVHVAPSPLSFSSPLPPSPRLLPPPAAAADAAADDVGGGGGGVGAVAAAAGAAGDAAPAKKKARPRGAAKNRWILHKVMGTKKEQDAELTRMGYLDEGMQEGCGIKRKWRPQLKKPPARRRVWRGRTWREAPCVHSYDSGCPAAIKAELDVNRPTGEQYLIYRKAFRPSLLSEKIIPIPHNKHNTHRSHVGMPMYMKVAFRSEWRDKTPEEVVNYFRHTFCGGLAIAEFRTNKDNIYMPDVRSIKSYFSRTWRAFGEPKIAVGQANTFGALYTYMEKYDREPETVDDAYVLAKWIDSKNDYIVIILTTKRLLLNMYHVTKVPGVVPKVCCDATHKQMTNRYPVITFGASDIGQRWHDFCFVIANRENTAVLQFIFREMRLACETYVEELKEKQREAYRKELGKKSSLGSASSDDLDY